MEFDFIDWLRQRLGDSSALRLGPGDDAALLRLDSPAELVLATDLVSDGVDFDLATDSPRRIGRKALAVNLSDLAAMAAEPVSALISLCLPAAGAELLARELYEGLLPLAEEFQLSIAGGDTNTWAGGLVINVAVLGRSTEHGALRRDRAKPGDAILVTGHFGGSRLGHQFDFTPRIREALTLNAHYDLHAGLDVSDGLALDLSRICRASDCGAVVETALVPVSAAAATYAAQLGGNRSPVEHALADGEDFELLLAVPPAEATRLLADQPLGEVPLTQIGHFTTEAGLWQRDPFGAVAPLSPTGWQH